MLNCMVGMMFVHMLMLIHAKDTELEDFVEKDIKIFFSSFPTFILGLDENNGILTSHTRYINPNKYKFVTRSRLVKSGNKYSISFGDSNICKDGNSVTRCKEERGWEFDRKPFGYTISTDGKCITKGYDDAVEMKPCVNTDDQIFGFKLADLDGCGSLESLLGNKGSSKAGTTNVNILPPGDYLTSAIGIATKKPIVEKSILVGTHSKKGVHKEIPIVYKNHIVGPATEEMSYPLYRGEVEEPKQGNVVVRQISEDDGENTSSADTFMPLESQHHAETSYLRVRRALRRGIPYSFTRGNRHLRHKHHPHKDHSSRNETQNGNALLTF